MRAGPCDIPFSQMGQLHFMDEWSEPVQVQLNTDEQLVLAQKRKCRRCGLTEYRKVKIA